MGGNTHLASLPKLVFGKLSNLQILDLSYNKISKTQENADAIMIAKKLRNIRSIYLTGNKVQ